MPHPYTNELKKYRQFRLDNGVKVKQEKECCSGYTLFGFVAGAAVGAFVGWATGSVAAGVTAAAAGTVGGVVADGLGHSRSAYLKKYKDTIEPRFRQCLEAIDFSHINFTDAEINEMAQDLMQDDYYKQLSPHDKQCLPNAVKEKLPGFSFVQHMHAVKFS